MTKKEDNFYKGLQKYFISFDDIQNGIWKYAGGTEGRHLNYFHLTFPNRDMPTRAEFCVCGHKITENCFITDGEKIVVLGNCCIKKFVPKSSRTCSKCGKEHKNRTVNRCNECRIGVCDKCGGTCDRRYKICLQCKFSHLDPTRVFTFGKHFGENILEVFDKDNEYCAWLVKENIERPETEVVKKLFKGYESNPLNPPNMK